MPDRGPAAVADRPARAAARSTRAAPTCATRTRRSSRTLEPVRRPSHRVACLLAGRARRRIWADLPRALARGGARRRQAGGEPHDRRQPHRRGGRRSRAARARRDGRRDARRGPRPREALPADTSGSSCASRSAPCTRSTACPSTSCAARRSGSWASRAAASRRPRGCCMRLLDPTSGSIGFDGRGDRRHQGARELKALRRDVQMVFQDPYSSLNPRKTVGSIIAEPFVDPRAEDGRGRAHARRSRS